MAGFAPNEEIELFEVSSLPPPLPPRPILILLLYCCQLFTLLFRVKEIKFEPNVTCEYVDKKLSFCGNQVYVNCFF